MFDIVDSGAEAYYEFSKVNVKWQSGQASDEEYLQALQVYANSFEPDTADYVNAQQRVKEARYNLARNKLLAQIEHGTKNVEDLLEFDTQALAGIEPGSQRFRDLRSNVENDTNKAAYDKFQKKSDQWQAGTITDEAYLDAYKEYVGKLTNPNDQKKAQLNFEEARYNIQRNKLLDQIDRGTKTYEDLQKFDEAALNDGVVPGSQRYREMRANVTTDINKGAYAEFNKIREHWQAGEVNDQTYISAFQKYVNKLTNPDDRENARLQLEAAKYTLARNAIVNQINKGNAQIGDLLAFDQQAINDGIVPGSDEYRTRLGRLQETQRAVFADKENDVRDQWAQGKMTTAQLLRWYQDATTSNLASGNQQLLDSIGNQIDSLQLRVIDEKDAKVVDEFNQGHMAANAFLVYARAARDRYATNTPQYREWDQRISDATQKTVEDNLLYRYGLTQQYADLKRFNDTHKDPPWKGGYTTQDPARYVIGADGKWTVVPGDTKRTPYDPTPDQEKSWQEVQATVEANKKQMRYIETQIGLVPGGWVDNQHLLSYYQGLQNTYVAGSSEWYQIQDRIDSVHQAMAQDQIYKTIGVTVTYPGTPNDPQNVPGNQPGNKGNDGNKGNKGYQNPGTSSAYTDPKTGRQWGNRPDEHAVGKKASGDPITIDDFMWALGAHESGNNYTAQNSTTGAYGKYQHLPQYWPSRAEKYLGNANAPMTPENQEKVTRGMIQALYDRLGDWRLVALAWHNGHVSSEDPNDWSLRNQKYVNRVMNKLGSDMWTPTTTEGVYAPDDWTANGGTPDYSPPPNKDTKPGPGYTPSTNQPDTTQPDNQQGPGNTPGKKPGADKKGYQDPGTSTADQPSAGNKFLLEYDPDHPGKVIKTGLPLWATSVSTTSNANFEDFYSKFQKHFRAGDPTFTVTYGGHTITYVLPQNTAARAEMMAQLDQVRIDLYTLQDQAYAATGDTDAARQAGDNLSKAYVDQGENLLYSLTMKGTPDTTYVEHGTGKSTAKDTPATSHQPIASGLAAVASLQAYMDSQAALAQAAYDRGDVSAAYAITQRANRTFAARSAQINQWVTAARQDVAAIQDLPGGAAVPDEVKTQLNNLINWDVNTTGIEKILKDLIGDGKGKTGVLAVNPDGSPKLDPNTGQVVLSPDWRRTLNPDGTIGIEYHKPTPSGLPSAKPDDETKVTVKVGPTVTDAYAKPEVDAVGTWGDGQTPILGRRVYDSSTDSYWYENPFQPGHWSKYPYKMQLPPGVQAAVDPTSGKQYIQFRGADGTLYRMIPDPNNTGLYLAGQWNAQTGQFVDGTTFTSAATDRSLRQIMQDAGFTRDTTDVPNVDKDFTDTTGPAFGFPTGNDYHAWITRNAPPPAAAPNQPPNISQWANPDRALGLPPPTWSPSTVTSSSGSWATTPSTTQPTTTTMPGQAPAYAQKTVPKVNVAGYQGTTVSDVPTKQEIDKQKSAKATAATTPVPPAAQKSTPKVTVPKVNVAGYKGTTTSDVPSKTTVNDQKAKNQQAAADKKVPKVPKVEPPPKKKKPVVVPHGAVDPRFL